MCPSSRLVVALAEQRLPLRRLPLHLPLASGLGLGPLRVHLLLEQPLALLLGLGTVDLGSQVSISWRLGYSFASNVRARPMRACA